MPELTQIPDLCTETIPLDTLTTLVGTVNTEIRTIVLGNTPVVTSDETVDRFDMRDTMHGLGVSTNHKKGIQTSHLGLLLERMQQREVLAGNPDDGYRQTLIGTAVLGFSGIVFGSAVSHDIPMKVLIGESSKIPDSSDNDRLSDPIATRIAIWHTLIHKNQDEWIPAKSLIEAVGEYDIGYSSAKKNLYLLINSGTIEKEIFNGRGSANIRLNPRDRHRLIACVADYFYALKSLAAMDIDALNGGIETYAKSMKHLIAEDRVPDLFVRSAHTTPRYDKEGLVLRNFRQS